MGVNVLSVTLYQRQTAWEETEEEYKKRCDAAQASKVGWTGTILGLLIAIPVLITLMLER